MASVKSSVRAVPPRSRRPDGAGRQHARQAAEGAVGGGLLAEVPQHHDRREQQRGRIRDALAGDVGRAAVDGLEHRHAGAEVRAGHDAEPADQPGAQVGDDVAVEVRQHDHVELLGLHHELHARGVDDALVVGDVRMRAGDLANAVEEQAVAELHDVRLVDRRDLLAAVLFRVREGEGRDALGRGRR